MTNRAEKELCSQLNWCGHQNEPTLTGPINKCPHSGIGEILCILMVEQWHSRLFRLTIYHAYVGDIQHWLHVCSATFFRCLQRCNKMLESLTWFDAIILLLIRHGCALEMRREHILAGRIRSPFQWPWFIIFSPLPLPAQFSRLGCSAAPTKYYCSDVPIGKQLALLIATPRLLIQTEWISSGGWCSRLSDMWSISSLMGNKFYLWSINLFHATLLMSLKCVKWRTHWQQMDSWLCGFRSQFSRSKAINLSIMSLFSKFLRMGQ